MWYVEERIDFILIGKKNPPKASTLGWQIALLAILGALLIGFLGAKAITSPPATHTPHAIDQATAEPASPPPQGDPANPPPAQRISGPIPPESAGPLPKN